MVPEHFSPLFRSSPFLDVLGPLYCCEDTSTADARWVLGMMVDTKHCNGRGTLHGGVISSLADAALGYNAAFTHSPPQGLVTASLNVEFTGKAEEGDWLEVHCDIYKRGRSLVYGHAFFWCDARRIAHTSGVFLVA